MSYKKKDDYDDFEKKHYPKKQKLIKKDKQKNDK